MPQEYRITAVRSGPRKWQSTKGGEMHSYRVDLADANGQVTQNVERNKKPTSDPPKEGDQEYGDIEHGGEYGPKFKTASRPGSGGGGGGGRAKRPDDDPKVYAARQAAIARQHSQEMALRFLESRNGLGDSDASDDEILDYVMRTAERFHEDVSKAARDAFRRQEAAEQAKEGS